MIRLLYGREGAESGEILIKSSGILRKSGDDGEHVRTYCQLGCILSFISAVWILPFVIPHHLSPAQVTFHISDTQNLCSPYKVRSGAMECSSIESSGCNSTVALRLTHANDVRTDNRLPPCALLTIQPHPPRDLFLLLFHPHRNPLSSLSTSLP